MPIDEEIDDLLQRLTQLEDEIETKVHARAARFGYHLERGQAVFEEGIERRHRRLRVGILTFLRRSPLAALIVAPAVYGLILPLALLDLGVWVFVHVCFPVWGIEPVRRRDHVVVDRHRLAYLNGIEKLNCAYCGYANGVIAYAREAASRTEQYWCPIKHALRVKAAHPRYRHFVDYGDAEGYRARLERLRAEVRKDERRDGQTPQ